MIKIYQFAACPFCQKVLRAVDELKLKEGSDYVLIEASRNTAGREEVVKLGGKSQVPFLVDDNTMMYESDDIVQYLRTKFSGNL
jgi:glutathione S-transferase